ncbi:Uncharacterized protein TCM_022755 [Theobroma cacao]|uniref:RNase H type-1 domain-containing protein n=1 Tax=Theobroma cacao TaxID=3641 RepID=A0A061F1I2_THECC|nr:Uncharacterized protein TCM_022755 [Theobroma cacao]
MGVYKGLNLAWELGFHKIIIQVDIQLVSRAITSYNFHPSSNSDLISVIHSLLTRQWEVKICHFYRKGNRLANFMASKGIELEEVCLVFHSPPIGASEILMYDMLGICFPQMIRI